MDLQSTITCPSCGGQKTETMPTEACQFFYECEGCGTVLRSRANDCCVFCSYGSVPCPSVQHSRAGGISVACGRISAQGEICHGSAGGRLGNIQHMVPPPSPEPQLRCYFHLVSSHTTILDDTGFDVTDLETAESQARQAIQELRQEGVCPDEDWRGWQLNVVDPSGNILFSISLATTLH